MGFEINPYDVCIANENIDGNQCTIAWHVDDNKVSHFNQELIDSIVEKLETYFGPLKVTKGRKHKYLGMNLDFRKDRKIEIDMIEYIKAIIKDFNEDVKMKVSLPARKELFEIKEGKGFELSEEKKQEFHSTTAKLVFIEKRARHDIEPAISFLTTRVTKSNKSDWWNLKRFLKWLWTTIDDKRIIGIDEYGKLLTYTDSSHAVHFDMRGHSGGLMSLGEGTLHNKSIKQKINTKSSTLS